jgi:hypothetical protein
MYAFNKATAQQVRQCLARRITGEAPVIDGRIDENVWNAGPWESGFTQRQPHDGEKATQETEFRILYDDDAIYVAIHALDSEPEKIERRLSRRDDADGDFVSVELDSYHDQRTSFAFLVNAAGVKEDFVFSNDGDHADDSWDPVWYAKTGEDDNGWVAEIKIPYTQLRFAKDDSLVWGLQVMRWLHRNQEFTCWQHIPMDAAGWVSKYGELEGIQGIKPKKEVELIPYLMGNYKNYEKEEGNPFSIGSEFGYNAGLDAKIAVSNDLTLNLTVNPDFGQVEADPSVVNLSAFETFYQEKRPFFVEGSNIFSFKPTGGDGSMSRDNLFYSRRIGRSPHYSPETCDSEYMEMPDATTILGAVKLSGKTRNGWSVGIMESVTQEEHAVIEQEGQRRKETVEPLTNYFNARLQRDLDGGNTILGGMVTATNRSITDSTLAFLTDAAYTGGLDFSQYWKDKTYELNITGVFSYVRGSTEAIRKVQESSVHYFQRPGIEHVKLDTQRTSLAGHGGTVSFAKAGQGHWRYQSWVTWRSPGLELNDMGYLRQSDIIQQVFWAGYRLWEPKGIYRRINVNFNQWSGWDFGGNYLYAGGNMNAYFQFKNYWSFQPGFELGVESLDRSNLRGGPAIKVPGGTSLWGFVRSDNRKKLNVNLGLVYYTSWQKSSTMMRGSLDVTYRPVKSLQLSLNPFYELGYDRLQYIQTVDVASGRRYLMGRIDYHMIRADLRVNLSLTPELSIQYWGQPFLFAGEYTEIKKAAETMATAYSDRFHTFTPEEISYDGEDNVYHVSERDGDLASYTIDNPDFKVFEWRSNLVARWEYIPGSAVYLVWSQGRIGDDCTGTPDIGRDMKDLFSNQAHNVFLVKLTYRLSI